MTDERASSGSAALTRPDARNWPPTDPALARWEGLAAVGGGQVAWEQARAEVLRWGIKTRSGFTVDPAGPVAVGDRPVIAAHPLGIATREPVEVVAVVDTVDRAGFAYRALPGHPVSGEEAFIVHRDGDAVMLTVRSLTGPSDVLRWRAAFPFLLVAQRLVRRRRYLRALRDLD